MKLSTSLQCLLICVVVDATPAATVPTPVHWRVNKTPPNSVRPDVRFDVVLKAIIDPGWHLYALQEPEVGPVPTEIAITEGDPANLLRVDQSRPLRLLDPQFGRPVYDFQRTATFTLHLRTDKSVSPGLHTLHVRLRYQACNDRSCLPPRSESLDVPLQTAK